ncbi:MAG: TonB-dependent receptor [Desulfocurvibacter africanus]
MIAPCFFWQASRRLASLLAFVLAVGMAAGAQAQQADDAVQLEPVVVTAEKREENVQDIPLSVTTFSEANIEDSGIRSLQDFSKQVPNLFISNWGIRGNSFVFMRGIGAVNNDPAIGYYVDDVSYMDSRVFDSALYDIERIEVLRGPQGTLYGRNSLGGVINFVTKKPDNETHAGLEQIFGNYDLFQTTAYLRTPIVEDKLFLSVAGTRESRDGYNENEFLDEDVDHRKNFSGRGHLRWTPNSKLDITLSADGERIRDGAFPLASLDEVRENPHDVSYDFEGKNDRDARGSSLRVAYDADWFRLTSISAYRHYDDEARNDQDFTEVFLANAFEDIDDDQFTQEIRFASPDDGRDLKWLTGLYGFKSKQDHELVMEFAPGVIDPTIPFTVYNATDSELKSHGAAVFGQTTYTMFDKLDLTAGLRYDYEKSSIDQTGSTDGGGMNLGTSEFDEDVDGDAWLPKFQAAYHWTPDFMTYAGVARGYRSAGFNTASTASADASFDAEYSWNYEVGFKSSWFDNRLTFNTAFFYIDLEDQQVVQLLPTADTVIRNAGESRSMGFEVESAALLAKGLTFEGGFGYTDAEYEEYSDELTGADYAGNTTPLAPEYTYNLALQYRYPLMDNFNLLGYSSPLTLFSRAELQGIGSFYWNDANTIKENAYELVNLRAGFETEHFDILLWAKNLFDKDYAAVAFEFPGSDPVGQAGDPQTFGLTLRARF